MIQCEECGEPITRQQVPLCDQCEAEQWAIETDAELLEEMTLSAGQGS